MAQLNKKETLKLYEIIAQRKNYIPAYYINIGGLIEEISDNYTQDTEWLIWGRTEKYSTDPDVIELLKGIEQYGLLYIVRRDNIGPYIERRTGEIQYIRSADEKDKEPPVFTFKVNPTHVSIQKRKLITKLRTKGGFVFQHWGPDITEISIEGTTGNITPSGVKFRKTNVPLLGQIPLPRDLSQEKPTAENSPAYAAFQELERIYDSDQGEDAKKRGRRLALEYRGRIYVGHLADFFFEERGERPFQFYYRLTFHVHYEATNPVFAETEGITNIQRNDETIQGLKDIRNASNEEVV